ncbi:uncharacterized protein LOC130360846 isoform X3 [Hyla sarda]|uniref:uncharacterized protein LOC130360846 isoform X3 n=1 Tax=Hyla sarda TaxID=327740 RepID=UPI0024C2B1E1|nr:uncharacterized protein LOC130360846 isoform X3 [Hyla sarda]
MPISHFKTTNITTDNMELNMDITTKELISAGNENSTYAYHTDSDLDLQKNAAGQPRGGYLDEQDGVYFFGNQSDFTLDHKPGDSLFVITTEIENKDVVLKVFQEDLVQSVRDKIMERMIYFPGGGNSLILKEFRWINVNRVKLTFWLQLNQGGKGMIHFLKSQLKALENYPFGSSSATLISFTVEGLDLILVLVWMDMRTTLPLLQGLFVSIPSLQRSILFQNTWKFSLVLSSLSLSHYCLLSSFFVW